ncbi:MAG: protein kinase, partial [Myxococcales bacterium]|nr:protein kinase [Myxococcales bacterium]
MESVGAAIYPRSAVRSVDDLDATMASDGAAPRPVPAGASRPSDDLEVTRASRRDASAPPPASPSKGARIGRYVILEELGAGAMGVVFAAYDPELDRKVAVKLLKPTSGRGARFDAAARLLREAQALARLSHVNVVGVHDVGLHEGQVFIAMEFVEGVT